MKIGFVVQRCGKDVNGGAELHCFKVAQHLARYVETEVLTTCALDYMTWKDHFSPGLVEEDGVKIRRFKVSRERDPVSFEKLCAEFEKIVLRSLPEKPPIPLSEQERWMFEQGPISHDLKDYIISHKDEYAVFIFFTYLYATTYLLLPEVKEKAILAPLAHDEWPIHLNMWDDLFTKPRSIIFNSIEEKAFLEKRFSRAKLQGPIVGVAIDEVKESSAERFRKKYGVSGPFILYIGRIDPLKGCRELFNYFLNHRLSGKMPGIEKFIQRIYNRFRRFFGITSRPKNKKLVLIGRATFEVPNHPNIVSLGFVDEQSKWDALAAADLLVLPSEFESLSMVVLEAWLAKKPVLVNGNCPVLVGQCKRSSGGLWYKSKSEFSAAMERLDGPRGKEMGENGFRYVRENYSWSKIEQQYLEIIKHY